MQKVTKKHHQLEERLAPYSELQQKLAKVDTDLKANRAILNDASTTLNIVLDITTHQNIAKYASDKIARWKQDYSESLTKNGKTTLERINSIITSQNKFNGILQDLRKLEKGITEAKQKIDSIRPPQLNDLTLLEPEIEGIVDNTVKQDFIREYRILKYAWYEEKLLPAQKKNLLKDAESYSKIVSTFITATEEALQFFRTAS